MTATAQLPAVWADVVGQERVVDVLARAVQAAADGVQGRAEGMTQAWLFT